MTLFDEQFFVDPLNVFMIALTAPRLNDVSLTEAEALEHHHFLLRQVVLMLCAGLVHGDLSEFNILLAEEGPVIIDLPQAVDATANPHAARMLERDVTNLADYFGQFAPQLQGTQYGKEIWQIFEKGELTPETVLTGRVEESTRQADVDGVMREIRDAIEEERMKQERLREME